MSRLRWFQIAGAGLLVLGVGCGIAVRRDLSAIPAGQVGFDDMCGLQDYFDALEIKTVAPPRLVSALDLEGNKNGKAVHGGQERFAFENEFLLTHLRRVLNENWRRLPEPIATATAIEIEVRWSEKAGVKRVVTDEPAQLTIGKETWPLPYHPCLSELLYGAPLYRQRREIWHLPLPGMGPGGAALDAGTPPTSAGPLFGDGGPATPTRGPDAGR